MCLGVCEVDLTQGYCARQEWWAKTIVHPQPLAGKGNGTFQPPPKKANPRPKTEATPHANFNPATPIQISSR